MNTKNFQRGTRQKMVTTLDEPSVSAIAIIADMKDASKHCLSKMKNTVDQNKSTTRNRSAPPGLLESDRSGHIRNHVLAVSMASKASQHTVTEIH
jgi:hypothetical protein